MKLFSIHLSEREDAFRWLSNVNHHWLNHDIRVSL
jgi:hypothetical protein